LFVLGGVKGDEGWQAWEIFHKMVQDGLPHIFMWFIGTGVERGSKASQISVRTVHGKSIFFPVGICVMK
jgi:hypothetical protein